MIYVIARLPVHRRGHVIFRGELDGIEHAQHLIEIASAAHRIDQHQLDLLCPDQ